MMYGKRKGLWGCLLEKRWHLRCGGGIYLRRVLVDDWDVVHAESEAQAGAT